MKTDVVLLYIIVFLSLGMIMVSIAEIVAYEKSKELKYNITTDEYMNNSYIVVYDFTNNYSLSAHNFTMNEPLTVSINCPDNTSLIDVQCECAKNTSTPCMTRCFECENSTGKMWW